MKKTLSCLLTFGLTTFFISNVNADEVIVGAEVDNSSPISSNVNIDSGNYSVYLTENSTTDVTVTATVTDLNGCEDIDSVRVKFFRTDLTSTGEDNPNHRYTANATLDVDSCDTGGSDLTSTWTALIPVEYYADQTVTDDNEGTTWSAEVILFDESTGTTEENDIIEMETLTALDVSSNVSFGGIALGENTGDSDTITTITNTEVTAQLEAYGEAQGDGYSMKCTQGTIPLENIRYSTSSNTGYESKRTLGTEPVTIANYGVSKRTTDITTGDIYWGFQMPESGINGQCSGTVIFTATTPLRS